MKASELVTLQLIKEKAKWPNEEKVQKYKQEIEDVFCTEKVINLLNNYDKYAKDGDTESVEILDSTMIGVYHKEYWVKFEVKEPDLLNSFLMGWVVNGKSIAGVQGSVLDFGGVCDKRELKDKLLKMIEELWRHKTKFFHYKLR